MIKNKIISLDIFDTCLVRCTGLPSSVFYLMASKILGPKAGRAELYEFVNARVRAEKAAKLMAPSGIEDVTMAEIYRHFNCPFKDADCTALIDMELQVESEVLRPVLSMLQFLNKERSLGKRIIYVTDNYLPADFIRGQLRKYGFWNDGDGLYVSGEIGLTKISGRLFDHVREKEGVRFSDISHYGDNQYADLNAAKRKGINAHLLDTGFNDFEFKWSNEAFSVRHPMEVYLLSGISRSIRLSEKPDVHTSLVLNAIAPVFIPFVDWLMRDAKAKGIRKLYFVARDGYMLHEIAKKLSVNYPGIELHYLYGSRRAFYLAGLKEGSRDELRWILSESFGKTPRQMLLRFNADVSMIAEALKSRELSETFLDAPMDKKSYELFLDVLSDASSRNILMRRVEDHRKLVRDFFRQEGMLSGDKAAIVDIGWSRFCHQAINVVLEPATVFGYFFGVFDERVSIREGGQYAAAFYPEEFYGEECNKNLLKHAFLLILEQFFAMNGQQSTIGFERKGDHIEPVFEASKAALKDFSGHVGLHLRLLKQFAEEYAKFENLIYDPEVLLRNCGYKSVSMLITRPTRQQARLFHDFMVDNGVDDPIPLVAKLTFGRTMKTIVKALVASERKQEFIWTEGTIAYSYGSAGMSLLHLFRSLKELFHNGRLKKKLSEN